MTFSINAKVHTNNSDDDTDLMIDLGDGDDAGNSSYEEGDVKRISSSSRVNFTKLTKKEQATRFKNMQKKI